jgi:hypothetical protein
MSLLTSLRGLQDTRPSFRKHGSQPSTSQVNDYRLRLHAGTAPMPIDDPELTS